MYACDPGWWDHHVKDVKAAFQGEAWTQDQLCAEKYGLKYILGRHLPGLCKDPDYINFGSNSGYQAMNLAYHWGARRMILLGFDMKNTGGKTHFFGDHPKQLQRDNPFRDFIEKFKLLAEQLKAEGVTVINCSRDSALPWFTKRPLSEVMCELSSASEPSPGIGEKPLPTA